VIATDISEPRLEAARRFGAEAALRADEDLPSRIRELNEGRLADLVIVCTGAESALLQALGVVEGGGTVLFFAPTDPGVTIPVSINETFFRNDVTFATSYAASPADYQTALDLVRADRLPLSQMITHRFGLAEASRGFQLVAEAGSSIKVIIEPSR
jgi:L-iditol 2-dehydrogenase